MQRIPVDPSLTLYQKWTMPTRLAPTYYWPATRNGLSAAPGILSVIYVFLVIYRRPGVYKQYQYTVMLITFGGYILMLPVSSFNWTVSLLLTIYDGGVRDGIDQLDYNASYAHSFHTSVWGCSLAKQTTHATMNSNFCMGFVISLMRYLLLLHGIEMTWFRVISCCVIVMLPNFLILAYIMFFGAITQNDCCEKILEVPEVNTPLYYYSYLMLLIIAAVLLNFRTLFYLMKIKKTQIDQGALSTEKSRKDQWNLTLGFLLQSFAPLVSFGSFVVFITMYLQGVLGPDWFSTYTNIVCFLSTLLNPMASMAFIPLFRKEFFALLRCKSVTATDGKRSSVFSKTTTTVVKVA